MPLEIALAGRLFSSEEVTGMSLMLFAEIYPELARIAKKAASDPDPSIRQKITRFMAEEEATWGGEGNQARRAGRRHEKEPDSRETRQRGLGEEGSPDCSQGNAAGL